MGKFKNHKKSTGTMDKKNVYYKVDDLQAKKIDWQKVVAFAGTVAPEFKKEVEVYRTDTAYKKPVLKLGKVKKTLVLRIKDGKKHVGEWILNEDFKPPLDVSGMDKVYAEKFKNYVAARNDLLTRMTEIARSSTITQGEAQRLEDEIGKLAEAAEQAFNAQRPEVAGLAITRAKEKLRELETIGGEAQRILTLSNTSQDEQRSWKASSLGLDAPDYKEYLGVWWDIAKHGQDVTSMANFVSGAVVAAKKTIRELDMQLAGETKSLEEALKEMTQLLADMTKLRKDAELWRGRIDGLVTQLERLRDTDLPALAEGSPRQERYDDDVPSRVVNSEGYAGRATPVGREMMRAAKILKKLTPQSASPEGAELRKQIVQEITAARDAMTGMLEGHKKVLAVQVQLVELIGDDPD